MKTSVILHGRLNEFTPDQLEVIIALAREYNGKFRMIATGLQLYNIDKDKKEEIIAKLPAGVETVKHRGVNAIVFCRGKEGCQNSYMNTMAISESLEDTQYGRTLPHKLKIGISGCPRSCADSYVRDIGLVGFPTGYRLVAGGGTGNRPKAAVTLLENLTEEEALSKVNEMIQWYEDNALPKEHFDHVLERLGNPFTEKE